jgi:hypothetical protein
MSAAPELSNSLCFCLELYPLVMGSHHFFPYDFPTGATCGEPDFNYPEPAMTGGVQQQVCPNPMWHVESAAQCSLTPSYPSDPYSVYPAAYPTWYDGYETHSQPHAMADLQPPAQEPSDRLNA